MYFFSDVSLQSSRTVIQCNVQTGLQIPALQTGTFRRAASLTLSLTDSYCVLDVIIVIKQCDITAGFYHGITAVDLNDRIIIL